MSELKTNLNNLKVYNFNDINIIKKNFTEEEMIEGHKFIHYAFGLYIAEEPFVVTGSEIIEIVRKYKNIGLYSKERFDIIENNFNEEKKYTIRYGFNLEDKTLSIYDIFDLTDIIKRKDKRCANLIKQYQIPNSQFGSYNKIICLDEIVSYLAHKQINYDDDKYYAKIGSIEKSIRQQFTPIIEPFTFTVPDDKKYLKFFGEIGYELTDGIYYFPEVDEVQLYDKLNNDTVDLIDYEYHKPVVKTGSDINGAILFNYHSNGGSISIIDGYTVHFICTEHKYFNKLRGLNATKNFEELGFNVDTKTDNKVNIVISENLDELLDINYKEIVADLGIKDITLKYSILGITIGLIRYDYAYIVNNNLVLLTKVNKNGSDILEIDKNSIINYKWKKEVHDLRLITELAVDSEISLHNGIKIPVSYDVISIGQRKLDEVLKEEVIDLLHKDSILQR